MKRKMTYIALIILFLYGCSYNAEKNSGTVEGSKPSKSLNSILGQDAKTNESTTNATINTTNATINTTTAATRSTPETTESVNEKGNIEMAIDYLLKEVPEIGSLSNQLHRLSQGKPRLITGVENEPDQDSSNVYERDYYRIYVEEDYEDYVVRRNTFLVRKDLSEILIFDSSMLKILPIDEWRKSPDSYLIGGYIKESIYDFLNNFEKERVNAYNTQDYSKLDDYFVNSELIKNEKEESVSNAGLKIKRYSGLQLQRIDITDNSFEVYLKENISTEEKRFTTINGESLVYTMIPNADGYKIKDISGWKNPGGENEPTRLQWDDALQIISDSIGTDIIKIINDTYQKEMEKSAPGEDSYITNVNYRLIKANLSNSDNSNDDYFVMIDIETSWWENGAELDLAFIKNGKDYDIQYKNLHYYSGKGIYTILFDINSDGIMELIREEDNSGNQSSAVFITIFMHSGDAFIPIFNEGLYECYGNNPYSYYNKFRLEKNSGNPKIFDIVFDINATVDEDLLDLWIENGHSEDELQKPIKDKIVFTFDGTKYKPDKEVPQYRIEQ